MSPKVNSTSHWTDQVLEARSCIANMGAVTYIYVTRSERVKGANINLHLYPLCIYPR